MRGERKYKRLVRKQSRNMRKQYDLRKDGLSRTEAPRFYKLQRKYSKRAKKIYNNPYGRYLRNLRKTDRTNA